MACGKDGSSLGRKSTRRAAAGVVGRRKGLARVVARPALFRTGVYTYIHLFGT